MCYLGGIRLMRWRATRPSTRFPTPGSRRHDRTGIASTALACSLAASLGFVVAAGMIAADVTVMANLAPIVGASSSTLANELGIHNSLLSIEIVTLVIYGVVALAKVNGNTASAGRSTRR